MNDFTGLLRQVSPALFKSKETEAHMTEKHL